MCGDNSHMNHSGAETMRDRAPRHRELWQNLLLACASLLVFLLVCELIVFRFVLPATDMPENAFAKSVIRYAPEQTGG
jgi:hypothetical protein